jgi:hypothetical protein
MQSIILCYPHLTPFIRTVPKLPLKTRSILIKQCQAQYDVIEPVPTPLPTIVKLLDDLPEVCYLEGTMETRLQARHFFQHMGLSVNDPLQSAIIIDILRGSPVTPDDKRTFINNGWYKEINLGCYRSREPEINFDEFFYDTGSPVHPSIPTNRLALIRVRTRFRQFRDRLLSDNSLHYPRASHKNMSRDTRRQFENHFGEGALSGIDIFGQDDWERVYEEHGIALEGACEIRQTWTASQAKPRIYAAQGGTAYKHSRHLQKFFSDLHDIFPPTHRVNRLRPGRLFVPPFEGSPYYLIYDLTSFTSNMVEQKGFCNSLAKFMSGVPFTIVDERDGPVTVDLGDLLTEYNDHCVVEPLMSLERSPVSMANLNSDIIAHARAALLGIFGNLMSCTVAHYLAVCQTIDGFEEDNTAGDDGLILCYEFSRFFVDVAISLVGDWEPTKCFRSDEEGAICLKRPIFQVDGELLLGFNLVPPNVINSLSYLLGSAVDDRYHFYHADLPLNERISTVGIDLLRFLRVCWIRQFEDFEQICRVYDGFVAMTRSVLSKSGGRDFLNEIAVGRLRSVWPINPRSYSFYDMDPMWCYAVLRCTTQSFKVKRHQPISQSSLQMPGDVAVGNSSPRLSLLRRLGYVDFDHVYEEFSDEEAPYVFYQRLTGLDRTPEVYRYVCLKDIPECFLYDD